MPARNLAVSSTSRSCGTVSAQVGADGSVVAALATDGAGSDFWQPKKNTGKASKMHLRDSVNNEPPGFPNLYIIVGGSGPLYNWS